MLGRLAHETRLSWQCTQLPLCCTHQLSGGCLQKLQVLAKLLEVDTTRMSPFHVRELAHRPQTNTSGFGVHWCANKCHRGVAEDNADLLFHTSGGQQLETGLMRDRAASLPAGSRRDAVSPPFSSLEAASIRGSRPPPPPPHSTQHPPASL